MISLKMSSTKDVMSRLLLSDTFDDFLFVEGEIVTFNTFTIDGHMEKDFFKDQENIPDYSSWKNIRDYCYSIIRGKDTPLRFHFVLGLPDNEVAALLQREGVKLTLDDVESLLLNFRFSDQGLICVTGTSLNTFTLDKTLEKAWDQYVIQFFEKKGIDVIDSPGA